MARDNDETAELSPERMQLVMWEGRAFKFLGDAAEADPDASFDDIWARFCADNPMPNVSMANFDPASQQRATRAAAEEIFNDNRP